MSHRTIYRKQVEPEVIELSKDDAIDYLKSNRFRIIQSNGSEEQYLIEIDQENDTLMQEKNCCFIEPFELQSGGPGQVLYLEMIRYFCVVFFIMSVVSIPVQQMLYQSNEHYQMQTNQPKYNPIALMKTDFYSFASIQNGVSYDPISDEAGNKSMIGYWLQIFIAVNLINISIFFFSIKYWSKRSKFIDENVDLFHNLSDHSLKISNLPKTLNKDKIFDLIKNIDSEILIENVSISNQIDEKYLKFKKLLEKAKILKELRCHELKSLVKEFPDKNREELIELIMEDDQKSKEQLISSSLTKAVNEYITACIECDAVSIQFDDFNSQVNSETDTIAAFVTFSTEKAANFILNQYSEAQECIQFKDYCTFCIDSKYPENLTQKHLDVTERYKISKCEQEPQDIQYENLHVNGREKLLQNVLFSLSIIFISVFSFIAIGYCQYQIENLPVPTDCSSTFYKQLVDTSSINFASYADYTLNGCASDDTSCNQNKNNYDKINKVEDLKQCVCINEQNQMLENIENPSTTTLFQSVCTIQLQTYLKIQLAPLFGSLFTLIMNQVMLISIIVLVPFTKPHSRSKERGKTIFWIYLAQFANMAVIPVVIYSTTEINSEWQQQVGITILNNIVLYSIMPNLSGLINPFIYLLKDWQQADTLAIYQDDYNLLMAGPNHLDNIYYRQSQQLCFMTCVVTFNGCFPILLPVGFIGLFIMYQVEKLTLLYAQRKTQFSSGLSKHLSSSYDLMALLQCAWVLWVFSNPFFMIDSKDKVGSPIDNSGSLIIKFLSLQDVSQRYIRTIPFTLIIVGQILYKTVGRSIRKEYKKLIGETEVGKDEDYIDRREVFQNLSKEARSYDIKQNDQYQRVMKAIEDDQTDRKIN